MKKLTKKIVVDYHKFMCEKFDAVLLTPTDNVPVILETALSIFNVNAAFLSKFAITFPGFGRNYIYVPWEPGIGKTDQYYVQVRRLAHECEHCVQIKYDRPVFATNYLTMPSARANYEALAMHAELELHFWYYGRAALPSTLGRMANGLNAYRCSDDDIAVTYKHLLAYNKTVARGSVSSEAGKAAIKWLEARI
jgi:hypothetical protein